MVRKRTGVVAHNGIPHVLPYAVLCRQTTYLVLEDTHASQLQEFNNHLWITRCISHGQVTHFVIPARSKDVIHDVRTSEMSRHRDNTNNKQQRK